MTSEKTHEKIKFDKTRSSYLFFKESQNYPSYQVSYLKNIFVVDLQRQDTWILNKNQLSQDYLLIHTIIKISEED